MKTIAHDITMPSGKRVRISAEFEASIQYSPMLVSGDRAAFIEESGYPAAALLEAFSGTFVRDFSALRARGFAVETVESGEWEIVEL